MVQAKTKTKTKTKTEAKDEKPGKVRRFLEFLHIKKKQPQVYTTSPELQRYELDMVLEDIEYYIGRLPDDHPRKADLKSTVGTLDRLGNKDIQDATQRAQGLFDWVKNEAEQSRRKPTVAAAPPPTMQPSPPTQSPASLASTAAPPPKQAPPKPPAPQSPPKAQPPAPPEGYAQPPEFSSANVSAPPPTQQPSPDAKSGATVLPEATKEKRRLPAKTLQELKVEKPLGEGNFATTYSMTGAEGQAFAVKVPKARQSGDASESPSEVQQQYIAEELAKTEAEFKREAEFYDRIQQSEGGGHPNIAKCYGYQTVGQGQDEKQGLVMEVVDGKNAQKTMTDLRARFLKGEVSSEEYFGVMQYTLEKMLEAAKFLGEQGVSHRDMKPDNVMIDRETGDVKLVDFGVSEVVGEEADKGRKIPIGFVPPEIAKKGTLPSAAEDPFGVGGTAYLWSEQQVFDYHKREGQTAGEYMRSYADDDRRAIEVAPQEPEAKAFKQRLDEVKDLFDEWENSTPAMSPEALSIREEMKDVQKLGAEKKFAEGQKKLESLLATLKTIVADDSGAPPQKRFARELKKVERRVDELADSLVSAAFIGEPFRLKSLLDAIRPLVAKARQHGDRMEFEPGLAVLAEASTRLKEAEAPSGQHNAQTLFTDFMNQLMHPDPAKRLTPEQALNHPFMKSRLLDEDAARRVLKAELAGPGGPPKPDDTAPDEKKWEAAEQSIYEAKRRLKALGACRPEDAARRQTVLNEMQLLSAQASKAAGEARQRKDDASTATSPENQEKAAKVAAKRWTDFSARSEELKTLLAAAQDDLEARKEVQAEVTRTGRLVQGLASRTDADISELQGLFKQAMALSKPGGPLDEARKSLAEIQAKIDEQFGANQKRALLSDGLAHNRTQVEKVATQAEQFEAMSTRYRDDAKRDRDDADDDFEAALKASKKQEKAKDNEEKRGEAKKREAEKRASSAKARAREEYQQKRAQDNEELARRRRELAEKATKMLAEAERLAANDIDAALAELDRASELLRVTLAEAAKTSSEEMPEGTYEVVEGETEESPEEQSTSAPQSGPRENEQQASTDQDSDKEEGESPLNERQPSFASQSTKEAEEEDNYVDPSL